MNMPSILQGWPIEAVVAIIAGIVILLVPRVLNYVVAVYLLVIGALIAPNLKKKLLAQ